MIIVLATAALLGSCGKDFLNVTPNGNLNEVVLANKEGIDAILVGAYSMLDGVSSQFGWESASSNWLFSDVRGMLANRGSDAGDQGDMPAIQNFCETPTNSYLEVK